MKKRPFLNDHVGNACNTEKEVSADFPRGHIILDLTSSTGELAPLTLSNVSLQ